MTELELPEGVVSGTPIAAMARLEPEREWPATLNAAAYHGTIGAFVRAIAPHTEGDPAAILIQGLICAGNAFGRNPYFAVEDTRHHANLFAVIAGASAKARKGTSLNRARKFVAAADPEWGRLNDGDAGLSSGEGLIFA